MMKQFLLLLALSLTFTAGQSGLALAETDNAAEILLSEVARRTADVRSLSAQFTQKKKLAVLQKPLTSSGQFCMQRPAEAQKNSSDRVLWAYEKPTVSGFAFEDGQGWLWTDDAKARRPAKGAEATALKAVTEHILAWVRVRPEALQRLYTLTRLPDSAGCPVLRLQPRSGQAKNFFESLEVVFAPTLDSVRELRFLEKNGDSTVLIFEGVRLNEALPPQCLGALRP